jgi:hypothetical protein
MATASRSVEFQCPFCTKNGDALLRIFAGMKNGQTQLLQKLAGALSQF